MQTYHLTLMGLETYQRVTPDIPPIQQDITSLLNGLSIPFKIKANRLVLASKEVSLTAYAPEQKSDILECILHEWKNSGES